MNATGQFPRLHTVYPPSIPAKRAGFPCVGHTVGNHGTSRFPENKRFFLKDIRLQRIHALYLKAAENAGSCLLESPADPVIRAGTRRRFHAWGPPAPAWPAPCRIFVGCSLVLFPARIDRMFPMVFR